MKREQERLFKNRIFLHSLVHVRFDKFSLLKEHFDKLERICDVVLVNKSSIDAG